MSLCSWTSSSLVRHFPNTPPQAARHLVLDAALNEQLSFQVAVHLEAGDPMPVRVSVVGPEGWSVRVRRVGYVPILHRNVPASWGPLDAEAGGPIPGYVPDPLFDEDSVIMGLGETHAFWVTVRPAAGATAGRYAVEATVTGPEGERMVHVVGVRLHDVRLQPRRDFRITQWFYIDGLIDWYRTDMFDERFWAVAAEYVRDMVEHGQDTLYVHAFTQSTDGVKRPSQLLKVHEVESGRYEFDWGDVRRWVRLGRAQGIEAFEWCHLFTQWGAKHPVRIYEGQGKDEKLLWDPGLPGTSDVYRRFLTQFLPELRRFVEEEGITDRSLFHISDEPHGPEHLERYGAVRAMMRELAPWMKVIDALSDIEIARRGLIDTPIPVISTALDFHEEGIASWIYYCCAPGERYLSRWYDTPLPKIAMHGFLFYRWPFSGFLHWGYNYWYRSQARDLVDPYTVQDALHWGRGWPYGDPFVVYPGPDGPVDSLRWEVMAESLQDYRLLQTLNVSRDDALFSEIRSFADFPKASAWRQETRAQLLARAK